MFDLWDFMALGVVERTPDPLPRGSTYVVEGDVSRSPNQRVLLLLHSCVVDESPRGSVRTLPWKERG